MTNANDSAYPISETAVKQIIDGYGFPAEYLGMTKREMFAAMAMQGLISNPEAMKVLKNVSVEGRHQFIAETAVLAADALIKQLNSIDN